jgi:hypothetical protein
MASLWTGRRPGASRTCTHSIGSAGIGNRRALPLSTRAARTVDRVNLACRAAARGVSAHMVPRNTEQATAPNPLQPNPYSSDPQRPTLYSSEQHTTPHSPQPDQPPQYPDPGWCPDPVCVQPREVPWPCAARISLVASRWTTLP